MADEDEIDVLGDDFLEMESLLTKDENRMTCYDGGVSSDLLHCDYQSSWYQDVGSWYERSHLDALSPLPFALPLSSSPNSLQWNEPSPVTSSTANSSHASWSEKERTLLEEGLELFGRSWSRLAQFIGTKTSHQIKSYLKMVRPSSESEAASISLSSSIDGTSLGLINENNLADTELIDDMQIPASMEEVIAVVSTAQPTITTGNSHVNRSMASGGSIGKKKRQKETREMHLSKAKRGRPPRADSVKLSVKRARGRPKKLSENGTIVHDANVCPDINVISELTETPGLGEEVVRIKREGSHSSDDSDVEIDIEDHEEKETNHNDYLTSTSPNIESICTSPQSPTNKNNYSNSASEHHSECVDYLNLKPEVIVKSEMSCPFDIKSEFLTNSREGKSQVSHQDLLDQIHALPSPTCERVLQPSEITDEERSIHAEFFEGRPAKTPKRYLKIRNHIIDTWLQNRPSYVTKTSVRAGLRNCGDVNCIGRIHSYLEQTGVINFGCEQTKYSYVPQTPVPKLLSVSSVKEKSNRDLLCMEGMRPRKKKQEFDEEKLGSVEGGYTIQHTEDGRSTLTYNTVMKTRNPKADSSIKLLYCTKFSNDKPAPFTVHLHIGALLVVDVHAHCSHDKEVMGLLGGELRKDSLHIVRAVSCLSSLSSSTHCDMCPVSQSEASDVISKEGLSVVGWYHSHPTFVPNPSLQDLSTQAEMQRWFSDATAAPFVGLILSPYCASSSSLASLFRVLIVDPEGESGGTPYRFPVNIVAEDVDIEELLTNIDEAAISLGRPSFDGPFYASDAMSTPINGLQKCLESVRIHLESCQPQFKLEERIRILKGINIICRNRCNL